MYPWKIHWLLWKIPKSIILKSSTVVNCFRASARQIAGITLRFSCKMSKKKLKEWNSCDLITAMKEIDEHIYNSVQTFIKVLINVAGHLCEFLKSLHILILVPKNTRPLGSKAEIKLLKLKTLIFSSLASLKITLKSTCQSNFCISSWRRL